jgi:RNA polymerase sigma-70 factor (ECF subfamily)
LLAATVDHRNRFFFANAYVWDVGQPRTLDPAALGDHLDRLFRAAWALCGRREDAEDLVQDTYARVLARPRFLRHDDDLGYLLRVLRNTHVSRVRSAARRPRTAEWAQELDPPAQRSDRTPEGRLDAAELFLAISQLPDDFRDALVAIDVAGLSYGEAARALKVPEATITTRLHRARTRVADALRAADVTPTTPAAPAAPGSAGKDRTG